MTTLGPMFLWTAVVLSAAVLLIGLLAFSRPHWSRRLRRLALVLCIPWLAALGALLVTLCSRDDRLAYVVEHVDPNLPTHYRVAALWAGQEGSLLSLAALISLVGSGLAVTLNRVRRRAAVVAITITTSIVLGLGLMLVIAAPPFRPAPEDLELVGAGQQLRHWAMLIHPPMILTGYALCAAPFAIAVGTALCPSRGVRWANATRSWAYGAWMVLGAGISLGAWWAYTQLGWGGYWAWDPVENVSLLPWLTVTALIHGIAVYRARGVLATWTHSLALLCFVLCMFGTFVTRGGMVDSVHSFGRSSLGAYLGVLVFCLLVCGTLAGIYRVRRFAFRRVQHDLYAGDWLVLAGTLLLMFSAAAVLVGTAIPMIASIVLNGPASITRTFYESTIGPASVFAALLLAVAPVLVNPRWSPARVRGEVVLPAALALAAVLIAAAAGVRSAAMLLLVWACFTAAMLAARAWFRAAREHVHVSGVGRARALLLAVGANPRAHGGRLAHVGLCVLLCGVCASSVLASTWDVTLHPGETRSLGSWKVTLERVTPEHAPDSLCVRADLSLVDAAGTRLLLTPRRRHYDHAEEPVGEVAIRSTLIRDVYVGLGSWDDATNAATLHVRVLPLVMWIWIGAALGTVGGAMCVIPSRRRQPGVELSAYSTPLVGDGLTGAAQREAAVIWKAQI
ncbi:MAG: cytochrome c biogenesis protein CcsA [Planctomycetes bacterium]|nr:cytochrome c biogenesis protein CcsA [Planctomycetota bacterium]